MNKKKEKKISEGKSCTVCLLFKDKCINTEKKIITSYFSENNAHTRWLKV